MGIIASKIQAAAAAATNADRRVPVATPPADVVAQLPILLGLATLSCRRQIMRDSPPFTGRLLGKDLMGSLRGINCSQSPSKVWGTNSR